MDQPPLFTASLFDDDDPLPPVGGAADPDPALAPLAGALPPRLWLGTSSWHYPGWAGRVWDRTYTEEQLA
ncbi:hypothetical protein B27N_01991, partial [Alcanivorax marinus]|nr:hypothetical protein [Alloalcanivorax marinus]